ncbi:MAG: hypothetical protein K9J13_06850 [Saprospiraceae bacterium]|nr:hypothetical protein [Saprospiraceae bacterium]
MDIDEYLKKFDNPNLISGIHNYCDRWCERCSFTQRCANYDPELDIHDENNDINNEKFWQKLSEIFAFTKELILRDAEKLGIDLNNLEPDPDYDKFREKERKWKRNHPLSKFSNAYAKKIDEWFDKSKELFSKKGIELESYSRMEIPNVNIENELVKLKDSIEVIRWYQFFINVKINRALSLKNEYDFSVDDSNGSAKVALVGIDRSLAAWSTLLNAFEEDENNILSMLVMLEQLRKKVENHFPNARAFKRPGFEIIDLNE